MDISGLANGETTFFVQKRNVPLPTAGDSWVIVHARPRPGSHFHYVAAARLARLEPLGRSGHFAACLSDFLQFAIDVPSSVNGYRLEPPEHGMAAIRDHARDARVLREITHATFETILTLGSRIAAGPQVGGGLSEEAASFSAAPEVGGNNRHEQRLVMRSVRDAAIRRRCLAAYSQGCAISGDTLLDIDGRTLCEAAHLWPRQSGGPDHITNLILMTPTIHRAWDAGLIALDDDYRILLSPRLAPGEIPLTRNPGAKTLLPSHPGDWPDLRFIRRHRAALFRS